MRQRQTFSLGSRRHGHPLGLRIGKWLHRSLANTGAEAADGTAEVMTDGFRLSRDGGRAQNERDGQDAGTHDMIPRYR
ncbi:hypothetical protein ACS8YF_16950 [Salinisphaera sp. SWV1]